MMMHCFGDVEQVMLKISTFSLAGKCAEAKILWLCSKGCINKSESSLAFFRDHGCGHRSAGRQIQRTSELRKAEPTFRRVTRLLEGFSTSRRCEALVQTRDDGTNLAAMLKQEVHVKDIPGTAN
jgi:hypothetical protein